MDHMEIARAVVKWIHVDNCTLLNYYAASSCSSLPTLREKISVQFSRAKNQEVDSRCS
jgi:hypothetical protein